MTTVHAITFGSVMLSSALWFVGFQICRLSDAIEAETESKKPAPIYYPKKKRHWLYGTELP